MTLSGGTGNEAYAQIGQGGAESNKGTQGYSNTGNIVLTAANVILGAGTGNAAYVQIGHGGFESGLNLAAGAGVNSGNISVTLREHGHADRRR